MYGTVWDVGQRWRPLSDQEQVQAAEFLVQAERVIHATVPSVPGRIEAGGLDLALVADVAVDMVVARMRQPAPGVKSESRTLGPSSETRVFDTGAPSSVAMTDHQIRLLSPPGRRRVGTVRTGLTF